MALLPQVLLSKAFRDRCVTNLKEAFNFTYTSNKHNQYASVLIPMCVRDGELHILYTLRSSNLKNHSGQVSFPGGKMEDDESPVLTALRETEEEIGVPRSSVDVWCTMFQFHGLNKDMAITPVVGEILNFDFDKLVPNTSEVEEIFTVPIESLCDTKNHGHCMYNDNPLPIYLGQKHKIWGITGFITHIFLSHFLPQELYTFQFDGPRFEIEALRQSKL